jgi:hypothetical protein
MIFCYHIAGPDTRRINDTVRGGARAHDELGTIDLGNESGDIGPIIRGYREKGTPHGEGRPRVRSYRENDTNSSLTPLSARFKLLISAIITSVRAGAREGGFEGF